MGDGDIDARTVGECLNAETALREENRGLRAEVLRLQGIVQSLADRVAQQSELLMRRAEVVHQGVAHE